MNPCTHDHLCTYCGRKHLCNQSCDRMKKPKPEYVLRGGIPNDFPQYSVVKLVDMGGETMAFFYSLREAKRYMAWRNGKPRK